MKVLVLVVIIFLYNSFFVYGLSKPCPTLTLKNGSVRYRSKGRIAKFRCGRAFILNGENVAACIRGAWDVDVPRCAFKSSCQAITRIPNGHVFGNKQWTILRFICNNGYHLYGRSQLQCRNSKWDGEAPQCLTSVQLSCDFESYGICGWDNATRSGYFWRKRQFATPSHFLDTGPGHDHTLHPKNNGHYLYIETSGLSSKTHVARLHSPLFPPVENNGTCFTFWYHMFGTTIGKLIVYIDGHKVFHKSGNQGNRWIKGVVKNLPSDTFFQISIEGVAGSGWTGDIAIDDLNITSSSECTRPDIEDTTCDGRCYEDEVKNSTLCQCNQECVANSTCCSDFFDVCNADISSTGLPYSSLISEDGSTMISSEDHSESTIEYDASSVSPSVYPISLNYSNKYIDEHPKKSMTHMDEDLRNSTSITNNTNFTSPPSAQNKGISSLDTIYTTSVNEETNTEENHSNSSSTYKYYPFFSQVPTLFYTSDLAFDYSESKNETYNQNNLRKEFSKENTNTDSTTDAAFKDESISFPTVETKLNSSFISSSTKNSSIFYTKIPIIESNLTINPKEAVLTSNVSLKVVVPHTHLPRKDNISQIITTINNVESSRNHSPTTRKTVTHFNKKVHSIQTTHKPIRSSTVTASLLRIGNIKTHKPIQSSTVSNHSNQSANSTQTTHKPILSSTVTAPLRRIGIRILTTHKPIPLTTATSYMNTKEQNTQTLKPMQSPTVSNHSNQSANSTQTTHKPILSSTVTAPLRRVGIRILTTQKPIPLTTATSYLSTKEQNTQTLKPMQLPTVSIHTNQSANSTQTTYKPILSSTVTAPLRRVGIRILTTQKPIPLTTATSYLNREEQNTQTTHKPILSSTVTNYLFRIGYRTQTTHKPIQSPTVTTPLRRIGNRILTTQKPIPSTTATSYLNRKEQNTQTTHKPIQSSTVTSSLFKIENNSQTTRKPIPFTEVTTHLLRIGNRTQTTHKPIKSPTVTAPLHRIGDRILTTHTAIYSSTTLSLHSKNGSVSPLLTNATRHVQRTENTSLVTRLTHFNGKFVSTTDFPITKHQDQTTTTTTKTQVSQIIYKIPTKKVELSQTKLHITKHTETTTEILPISVDIELAGTESNKWKSVYRPKGYYVYSARKQEQTSYNGYKNIAIILGIAILFIICVAIGIYIYRRRSFINSGYNVEEADVLFVPNDEMLDFSVASTRNRIRRKSDMNKVLL